MSMASGASVAHPTDVFAAQQSNFLWVTSDNTSPSPSVYPRAQYLPPRNRTLQKRLECSHEGSGTRRTQLPEDQPCPMPLGAHLRYHAKSVDNLSLSEQMRTWKVQVGSSCVFRNRTVNSGFKDSRSSDAKCGSDSRSTTMT